MAKTNYSFEKRQRELEKKRKQEEKRLRKLEGKSSAEDEAEDRVQEGSDPAGDDPAPSAD